MLSPLENDRAGGDARPRERARQERHEAGIVGDGACGAPLRPKAPPGRPEPRPAPPRSAARSTSASAGAFAPRVLEQDVAGARRTCRAARAPAPFLVAPGQPARPKSTTGWNTARSAPGCSRRSSRDAWAISGVPSSRDDARQLVEGLRLCEDGAHGEQPDLSLDPPAGLRAEDDDGQVQRSRADRAQRLRSVRTERRERQSRSPDRRARRSGRPRPLRPRWRSPRCHRTSGSSGRAARRSASSSSTIRRRGCALTGRVNGTLTVHVATVSARQLPLETAAQRPAGAEVALVPARAGPGPAPSGKPDTSSWRVRSLAGVGCYSEEPSGRVEAVLADALVERRARDPEHVRRPLHRPGLLPPAPAPRGAARPRRASARQAPSVAVALPPSRARAQQLRDVFRRRRSCARSAGPRAPARFAARARCRRPSGPATRRSAASEAGTPGRPRSTAILSMNSSREQDHVTATLAQRRHAQLHAPDPVDRSSRNGPPRQIEITVCHGDQPEFDAPVVHVAQPAEAHTPRRPSAASPAPAGRRRRSRRGTGSRGARAPSCPASPQPRR